jgi:branched-subunit amino acid transport protein
MRLSAKTTGAFVTTIIAWIVVEYSARYLFFELLGTASLTGFVVLLLGVGLVGPGLAALLFGSLSTVKVHDAQ